MERRNETIRKRVAGRMKGLCASILTLVLIASAMMPLPAMAAGETDSAGGAYWLVVSRFYMDMLFGQAQESGEARVLDKIVGNESSGYRNSYVEYDTTQSPRLFHGINSFASAAAIKNDYSGAVYSEEFTLSADTDLNFGCVISVDSTDIRAGGWSGSGAFIEVSLPDGTKAASTGALDAGKGTLTLPAGTYKLKRSPYTFDRNLSPYTATVPVEVIPTKITLDSQSLEMKVSDTAALAVSPSIKSDSITWTSSATAVATVDASGKVTAVSAGDATITATYTETTESEDPITVSATCAVKVLKEKAVVTKAPTANTLTYNGQAQALVTAGTATGGEMQYALGTTTESTQPYTTSIPTGTDAGNYYVWYKAVGDESHSDTEPECIEVTIKDKTDDSENEKDEDNNNDEKVDKKELGSLGNGTVMAETRIGSGSPVGKIENIDMDFAKAVLTEDEQKEIEGGSSCLIYMKTNGIDDDRDHSGIDEKMKENVSGASFGMLFDISLYKQIGNSADVKIKQSFKDNPVKITMAVPEKLQSENRMFYVGCEHETDDGTTETEYIETTKNDDGTISFEITGCSTYALYYTDPVKESSDSSSASTAAGYVTRQRVDATKLMSLPSGVKIKYTTSDKKLAKVSRKGVIKIQKQAGTVTITAKNKNTGATIDSCTLVIEKPVIKQKKLVVTGITAGNTDSWKTRSANEFLGNTSISPKWYSSKPSVAAVDQETGEVTIKGRGKAKIYAVFGADAVGSKFGTRKIYKYKIVSKK